jgi:hypothetical protein
MSPQRPSQSLVALLGILTLISTCLIGCAPSTGTHEPVKPDQTATGREGGGPARYDSPEAVYDAAKAAHMTKDYNTFCDCLTPESQGVDTIAIISTALLMKEITSRSGGLEGEQAQQDLKSSTRAIDDVLAKYGMKDDQLKKIQAFTDNMDRDTPAPSKEDIRAVFATLAKFAAPITDKPAFMAEINKAIDAHYLAYTGEKYNNPKDGLWCGELESIKREGDRATAQVVGAMRGKEVRATIGFVKINGGWLIDLLDAAPIDGR